MKANRENLIEKATAKPQNYPVCLNMQCSLRERCLHAIESTEKRLSANIITCVNPSVYTSKDICPEFRDKDSIAYVAFGMRGIAEKLKESGCYGAFVAECLKSFCHTVYYEMLAGEHVITPSEQNVIRECAKRLEVALPEDSFDKMIAMTAW